MLGEAQMVGVCRPAPTNQARLLGHELTCSLSRKRRGSGWVSRLLSMPLASAALAALRGRCASPEGDFWGAEGVGGDDWPLMPSTAANFARNASSTCLASTSVRLFLAARIRCAQVAASSGEEIALSSSTSRSRNMADATRCRGSTLRDGRRL